MDIDDDHTAGADLEWLRAVRPDILEPATSPEAEALRALGAEVGLKHVSEGMADGGASG